MDPMCLPFEEVDGQWQEATNPAPGCVQLTQSGIEAKYFPRVCNEATGVQGDLASDAQYQVRDSCMHGCVQPCRCLDSGICNGTSLDHCTPHPERAFPSESEDIVSETLQDIRQSQLH